MLSLVCALITAASPLEDLAKRYPATLSWVDHGLDWRCDPGDVWSLKSFALEFGKDFALTTGKATVALGVHETNVVWAVVLPEQPAALRATGRPGDGEQARAIFLRFAPADLGRVFPSKTVAGNGDPWLRAQAERIFRQKLGYDWYTPAGNPTIVPSGITLVDVDTAQGKRRFFKLDGGANKVTYVAEFESKPVPADTPVAKPEAERVFAEVWSAFDAEYANFVSLPKLDWKKLGDQNKKQLARVDTCFDLAAVLADMLAPLEDLHVWVKCGEDWLPQYSRARPLNGSWKACEAAFGGFNDTQHDLVWARTKDAIGYVNVHGLVDAELTSAFDGALEALGDTWGLVIDLRFNGGGGEDLAQALAGRLVDQDRVYSTNQYRSGASHAELGPVLERKLAPRGPWRYEAPVIALFGQRTMSSAESFALMLAQCPQVTTMGDRTAGSSANPRRLEPGCGITVNLPRWRDMDPAGNPIEHVGVAPEVKLAFPPERFTNDADPVLDAALERLRKTPKGERKPGKR